MEDWAGTAYKDVAITGPLRSGKVRQTYRVDVIDYHNHREIDLLEEYPGKAQ